MVTQPAVRSNPVRPLRIQLRPQEFTVPAGRVISAICVLLLHGAIIYFVAVGSFNNHVTRTIAPIQIQVLHATRVIEKMSVRAIVPMRIPLVLMAPPEFVAPPADESVASVQAFLPTPATDAEAPIVQVPVDASPAQSQPSITAPRPLRGPNESNWYPRESLLARETGRPTVKICISETGAVTHAEIAVSSGYERLDRAAVAISLEYLFAPAKHDGKPIATCAKYRIRFRIYQ